MLVEYFVFAFRAFSLGGGFMIMLYFLNGYLGIEPEIWTKNKRKISVVWIVSGTIYAFIIYGV